jgi:hypothetical protein
LSTDWNDIDQFIRTVRAPRHPTQLSQAEVAMGEALFREARCAACHGGPGFTLSRVFYEPGEAANGALPYSKPSSGALKLGTLRTTSYRVPEQLKALNPPGAAKDAPFRSWAPVDASEGAGIDHAYAAGRLALGDQLNCALRAVGTFPSQSAGMTEASGIVAPGAPAVLEVLQDMQTLALGETGFNIPSLLGLGLGAPYFHAGNARTLEEVFDDVFEAHHGAIVHEFLADPLTRFDRIRSLVSYLLSIDDDSAAPSVPSSSTGELPFEPDLCAQFVE